MNPEHERRVQELFDELCDVPEPERTTRLAKATRDDPELIRAVQTLFREDAAAGSFLDAPLLGPDFRLSGPYAATGRIDDGSGGQHPEAIGPYRIQGVLGQGGMGVVYRAFEQRLQRVVALKILREGLPGSRPWRHFELEAEALARLRHPAIATIFEAGTADFGRGPVPFLAMELVPGGIDLAHHAQERGLDLRQRAEILVQVCVAVHHAHQNRVIHRDLKPGNILVDSEGRPRVVDFGLARLLDSERTQASGAGDVHRIIGTLAYMSPEQVTSDPSAPDTSADVYSLGATGYHVFSGRPPYELDGLNLPAALVRVSREEPKPLSAVVPHVGRDLTAIVSKAMAREKEKRYPSASALAEDLTRWLNHQPVVARPASTLEQIGKFARRNRLLVGASATLLLVLVSGMIVTTSYARKAHAQSLRAQRIKTYLQDTLRSAGDPRTDGREHSPTHMLARATLDLERLADDPETLAEVADTLGMAYHENGAYADAERLVRTALDERTRVLGPRNVETLASQNNLGIVLVALSRLGEAEAHLRRAYEGRLAILGDGDEATQRSANWLGQVLLQKADPAGAELIFSASLAVRRRTLGEEALPTLSTRQHLALAWRRMGRIAEAESALREIVEVERRVCGPDDFEVFEALNNLASLLAELGRQQEAEGLLVEAQDGYQRLRGPEHHDTLLVRENLQALRAQMAPPAETAERTDGDQIQPGFLVLAAGQRFYRGELQEAEGDLERAIAALRATEGQEGLLLAARQNLANVLVETGRVEAGLELQREIVAGYSRAGTERSMYGLMARAALADTLSRTGKHADASREARAAFDGLEDVAGERGVYTLGAMSILATVLARAGRLQEALEHSQAAVSLAESALGAKNAFTAIFRFRLGSILSELGRFEEAEQELLASHETLATVHTERGTYTQHAIRALIELYESWERVEEAERWRSVLGAPAARPIEASLPK